MTRFITAAQYVLDITREAYPEAGRIFIQPGGDVAWDDCCNGQLWVRVIESLPKMAAQARSAVDPRCLLRGWQLRVGIGHLHCVSTLDDQGRAPAANWLTTEASEVLTTAWAIQKALLCHAELGEKYRPVMGSWRPLGPSGGCAGGEWQVDLDISA